MPKFGWIYETGLAACVFAFIFGAWDIAHLIRTNAIPRAQADAPKAVSTAWPEVEPDAFAFDGSIFKKAPAQSADIAPAGNAAKRFRLAGTFFAVGSNQQSRKAILDDLQKKQQLLVSEGDLVDGDAMIISILSDRVILRRGNVDEQIVLCFVGSGRRPGQNLAPDARGKPPQDLQNRFGKRVGDRRWVLKRSEILNYYAEVWKNPERWNKVFESLKPVYDGQNIAGYHLDIEGEGEMFSSFGLQQGDIIRQVNSLPMTSVSRATYFINEFLKDRVSGFVFDIERGGKKEKLIYMIR